MKKISVLILFFCCLSLIQKPLAAQSGPAGFERQMDDLQTVIRSLQSTVNDLQRTVLSQNEVIERQNIRLNAVELLSRGTSAGLTSAPSAAAAQGPLALTGPAGFNPEIGVVGTVEAKTTENAEDAEGNNTIALKELEFNFASAVDPYSRLDAIISFNDNIENQNVDIEEAYYTRWGLPLGFTGQIGKFRSKIGQQNLKHLHQLDTTDYPLVIRDFFGEEGLAASGARLQNNIPNPWDTPLEVTVELLRGNNGSSFSGVSRRPIFNTHLKTFFETSQNSNLELGATAMFGDSNRDIVEVDAEGVEFLNHPASGRSRYDVHVFGGDATWHWFLPEGRSVKFQNEAYVQQRGGSNRHVNKNPWGFYSLLDYRFSQRFSAGLRFDCLQPLDILDEHRQTTAWSPYLTFWQSEFASFKLQYTHTEPAAAADRSNDEVFLQANFLIGAHKHPVQ